jgi:glutaredoxin-related protein
VGGSTFPQIEIGGRVVNGFNELRRLERSGELERIAA